MLFLEADLLRSILSTGNDSMRARLADGSYDDMLEESRPDLVLAATPLDPRYRAEAERRGWAIRYLDPNSPNRETEATAIVRDVLNHHRISEEH